MWFWLWEHSEPGVLKLEVGEPVNALEFLAQFKATDGKVDLGQKRSSDRRRKYSYGYSKSCKAQRRR